MSARRQGSKELVAAVFRKEKTPKAPVNHRGFSSRAASHILGREAFVGGGIQQWREAKALWEGWHDEYLERSFRDAMDISLETGQDILRPQYWRLPSRPTGKVDDNTYLYESGPRENWRVLKYSPESEQASLMPVCHSSSKKSIRKEVDDLEKRAASYKPEERLFHAQIKAQELYGEDVVVESKGASVGVPPREDWLCAMALDPALVRHYVNMKADIAEKNVEFLSGLGFRYFLGGNDFASESGPFYSAGMFKDILLPGLQRVSSSCHRHGCKHLFASDGNLWPVAGPLFADSGIDGYYEIDRQAGMDLAELRKQYPGLTLLGNISSLTLSRGSVDDVKNEVSSCLQASKEWGGIIVGVSNYIMPETPPENIDAMLDMLSGR